MPEDPDALPPSGPPTPGPAGRLQRTAGQVGGSAILLDLVISFGWFGSNSWTTGQTTAVTAAVVFAIAGLHNLGNWISERRAATDQAALPAPSTPPGPPEAPSSSRRARGTPAS